MRPAVGLTVPSRSAARRRERWTLTATARSRRPSLSVVSRRVRSSLRIRPLFSRQACALACGETVPSRRRHGQGSPEVDDRLDVAHGALAQRHPQSLDSPDRGRREQQVRLRAHETRTRRVAAAPKACTRHRRPAHRKAGVAASWGSRLTPGRFLATQCPGALQAHVQLAQHCLNGCTRRVKDVAATTTRSSGGGGHRASRVLFTGYGRLSALLVQKRWLAALAELKALASQRRYVDGRLRGRQRREYERLNVKRNVTPISVHALRSAVFNSAARYTEYT